MASYIEQNTSSINMDDSWKTVTRKQNKKSDQKSRLPNGDKKFVERTSNFKSVSTSLKQDNNIPFINLKKIKLDLKETRLHAKVFKYIENLLNEYNDYEAINHTLSIGVNHNDKVLAITNLFFLAVRRDKITLMQKIYDLTFLSPFDKHYLVNAYDLDYTPLYRAATNGSCKAVKLLLHWGADPLAINKNGEDIYEALNYGLTKSIADNPLIEMFERPKFMEISDFVTRWIQRSDKDDVSVDEVTIDVEIQKATGEISSNGLIDTSNNIESQIENILTSCIEDYNTDKMTKLFAEINNLISSSIITKEIISEIMSNYEDVLIEEFNTIYSTISF
jgi:ankyrin repeat protein